MALINAKDILADATETIEIPFDFLELEEGQETPVLTIISNRKIRKLSNEALDKHQGIKRVRFVKGITEADPVNEPILYCLDVLDAAYVEVKDFFSDEGSKKAFLAYISDKTKFCQKLASKLLEAFGGGLAFREEDDDEKN